MFPDVHILALCAPFLPSDCVAVPPFLEEEMEAWLPQGLWEGFFSLSVVSSCCGCEGQGRLVAAMLVLGFPGQKEVLPGLV